MEDSFEIAENVDVACIHSFSSNFVSFHPLGNVVFYSTERKLMFSFNVKLKYVGSCMLQILTERKNVCWNRPMRFFYHVEDSYKS